MGKKKSRRQQAVDMTDVLVDEIDRRIEQCMALGADSFSERVCLYYDGKAAGLRELRDWVVG